MTDKKLKVKKYDESGTELCIRFGLGAIKAVGVGAMSNLIKARKQEGEFIDIYDFAAKSGAKILNKKSVEALSKAGAFDNIHENRNQILQSCEMICKYASTKEEEKNSSQMSLFESQNINIANPPLKKVGDWNKKEKLQKEFEAFGYFPAGHPLDDELISLKKRGVITSDILNEDNVIKDNSILKLSGVVAYCKHRSGPKGRFAYLTLSDPFGIYETFIFSEDLITKSRDLMEAGQSLVLTCLIRVDEGGTRILIRDMMLCNDFIKETQARNNEYQDIKIQPKKRKYNENWKEYSKGNDPKSDIVSLKVAYDKKISELKQKDIFNSITIEINNRHAILDCKSFLSQKLAPKDLKETTKIYIQTGNNKIELTENYLIEKTDKEKMEKIDGLNISFWK
jgi:DNA polymerase III alpha subunit